ncbi:MAG: hypothetical protein B7Z58_15775 [Acidiphilium sp. 37-64-53]|uniref:BrnT family toxin n=1 Tax=Acidiphilium TaxID=522 RepID=UPI000BD9F133|nr:MULTISPECIES: BrnT family toxin [Acidiphilium]OYW00367.1 MAG: hypothetical protein B7Z58_15775 [Acidiphilium sp. 37-64-53]OZB25695.1 MAG: hypothetical protein B7X49_13165 [Acidiphilium sp. 34-64-41]HQT86551.1 BrnT family toxin [Acidiphilium rubrum]
MTQKPFDPAKNAINQAKHDLPLSFGDRIADDQNYIELPSIRPEDDEERFKIIGLVETKLYTGVFTWRDGQRRFISVRRSNNGEQRSYHNPG